MSKITLKQLILGVTLVLFLSNSVFCQHRRNDKMHRYKRADNVRTQDCLFENENEYNGKVKYVKETVILPLADTIVKIKKEQGLKNRMDSLLCRPRMETTESFFDKNGNITHKYYFTKEGDTLAIFKYFYDETGYHNRSTSWWADNRGNMISEYSLPLLDKKGNCYINIINTFPDGKIDTLKSYRNTMKIVFPDSIIDLLKKDSIQVSFEVKKGISRIIQYNISKNQNRKITQEMHIVDGQLERTVQTFDYGLNSIQNATYLGHNDKAELISSRSESKFDEYGNQIEYLVWGRDTLEMKLTREIEYYE